MRSTLVLKILLILALLVPGITNAYFTSTQLATTVYLTNSTTAHVVESINLNMSNSSRVTYNQYIHALGLNLSGWQTALVTPLLVEHIINPKGSVLNVTFVPSPVVTAGSGYYASLTLSYYAQNAIAISNIAPRMFLYSFNDTAFNFQNNAGGQSLLPNTTLTFIVPNGTHVTAVAPLPDYPRPNALGQYNGTKFQWESGQPLQKFQFQYVLSESPQQEVLQYFNSIYTQYTIWLYVVVFLFLVFVVIYVYNQMGR